jgi:hypothetical protein
MIELQLTYDEALSLLRVLEFTKRNSQFALSAGSLVAIEKLAAEIDNYQQAQFTLSNAEGSILFSLEVTSDK